MTDAYILDAVRTPIGRYGGALAGVRPDDLAAVAIRGLIERSGVDPATVDDVILGCANQAGEDNRNVARMALLLAGMPVSVPGQTVNRLCGSGLQAVVTAGHAIRAGEGELFVAGGVESMSRAPWVMLKPDTAFPRGVPEMADSLLGWRFVNPKLRREWTISLGETAETVAECWSCAREEQDAFALESQGRAAAALAEGRFADEIVPVEIQQRKGPAKLVDRDEHPRADTTADSLAGLKPAFRREGGTVTAGNSSGLNDGAAALLVGSRAAAERAGRRPLARIVASAVAGVEPEKMGIGPVPATRKALERAGLQASDLGLVELNEAFAAQAVPCVRELGLDPAIVNVSGGAIALGHPLGCSGARILTTLVHEMRRRGVRYGLASMCIGVGQGIAVIVEAEGGVSEPAILERRDGAVAWITLNRPDRLNAFAGAMRDELAEALERAGADAAVRAVVVTGAGRAFCAGADVVAMEAMLAAGDEEGFGRNVEAGMRVVRAIRAAPKPVIAALNGVAAGAGASLAAACDLRVASERASLGFTFNRIGLHPDWGASYFLPRLVGRGRARELIFSARIVDAAEAVRIGLVDRLVPAEELAERVGEMAAEDAARAPLAIAEAKRSLDRDRGQLEEALRREAEAQLACFRSADVREGIAAFRERRAPRFTGA